MQSIAKDPNSFKGLMGKYFKTRYEQAELAYKVLKPERWVDRQNRGPEHVHHARFMRPLCQLIPEVQTRMSTLSLPIYPQDILLFSLEHYTEYDWYSCEVE